MVDTTKVTNINVVKDNKKNEIYQLRIKHREENIKLVRVNSSCVGVRE